MHCCQWKKCGAAVCLEHSSSLTCEFSLAAGYVGSRRQISALDFGMELMVGVMIEGGGLDVEFTKGMKVLK